MNAKIGTGGVALIGEYIKVADPLETTTAGWTNSTKEPAAWQTELAYSFPAMGQDAVVAIAYNGSNEAYEVGMVKSRLMALAGISVYENAAMNLEWKRDKDYSVADGGSGNDADTVTLQLAVTF
ncbi:hypothetical protein [Magnetococcus sp. PR-3]|uniref:hypothetical protein n=1 Tax=Magnetococcus sp. PR-3 TaxID=3120355 RepID=UPI002FCE0EBE